MSSSFQKELEFGNSFEKKLKAYLQPEAFAYNYDNEYDILTFKNGTFLKYEVKADKMMFKTGNLCIEFECSGKPSGIAVSQADIYAYYEVNAEEGNGVDNSKLYLIPKNFITNLISRKKYKSIINGGDGGRAKCYLFSLLQTKSSISSYQALILRPVLKMRSKKKQKKRDCGRKEIIT